jgi:hypothetical protein
VVENQGIETKISFGSATSSPNTSFLNVKQEKENNQNKKKKKKKEEKTKPTSTLLSNGI